MNTQRILAIAQKDLLEVRQNRYAWLPMIIVPILFVLILPLAMILIPPRLQLSPQELASQSDLEFFLQNMPPSMAQALAGLDEFQSMVLIMLGYLFAPFFLIFPLMFSTVIAAESFAGERERKTMEALLYTPASDSELFLGKVLAALAPAIGISWGSFILYALVLNTAGYPLFGYIWFPLPSWWPLILWITPALALLGTAATVLISARVHTFMGAYQTSASLVVLVVALLIGQFSGVVYLSVGIGLLIGLVLWLVAAGLTTLAVRSFHRHTLLTSD
ncbi:MAG: ABC transporter permease subunit [Chloroflexi bacterium]|nr:ABC transporter permease subunit [Chloroflexota bacterium]